VLLALACCITLSRVASAAPPCETPLDALGNIGSSPGKNCPQPLHPDTARGLALGTGARGSAISSSALAYNPAGLAVGRYYHIDGAVDYMPDRSTTAFGGSVIDSLTSRMAAGLALRGFVSGANGLGGIDGRLGIALPFGDSVSLGTTLRYINVKHEKPELDPGNAARGFTMDASLRIAPVQMLQLYVGGYNFINLESAYAPVTIGTGAAVTLGEYGVIGADCLIDLSSYRTAGVTVGGGLELLAAQSVPLRAGYSYDTKREQHTLSFGLGYTDRSVGLDLSLRQDVGGAGDTRLMGAFRFYVQ
jgi:opacity protein-like surface antigen